MSAIPAAPGEERLRLHAAWQGMTGARKSRVLALLGLAAVILAVLVYGIATSGRAAHQAAPMTQELVPGGGGEWLSQIPDNPRGKVPEPSPATVQTPVTPTKKETAATPPTLPPASTVGPVPGAIGAHTQAVLANGHLWIS